MNTKTNSIPELKDTKHKSAQSLDGGQWRIESDSLGEVKVVCGAPKLSARLSIST